MNKRLVRAMLAYAVLAVIALRVLHEVPLYAVLVVLGYFAFRTFIDAKRTDRPGPD